MTWLLLGLAIFLGTHSVRICADGFRARQVARMGLMPWKGAYSAASLIGLALIVVGFGLARQSPLMLWAPPLWSRHLALLLTAPAFILVVAAHLPGTHLKAALGHPMVAGVAVWAFAHLLADGRLHAVVLFGAFFVWAIADYAASRRRDRAAGTAPGVRHAAQSWSRDALASAIGLLAWALFAFALHGPLIGLRPIG